MRTLASTLTATAALGFTLLSSVAAHADDLTLADALTRAATHPSLVVLDAEVAAGGAERDVAAARAVAPTFTLGVGPRFVGSSPALAAHVGVEQVIERGGKPAARRALAAARREVVAAARSSRARTIELEVAGAFQLALVARTRLAATREAEQLAVEVHQVAIDSRDLGADTQLRVNAATADLGQARHSRLDAEGHYEAAIADLARALGAPAGDRVEPIGEVVVPPEAPWTEDAAVVRARAARPELSSADATLRVVRAEAALATAESTPDVAVGLAYDFEQDRGGADAHAVLVTFSVGLPLRARSRALRAAADRRVDGQTAARALAATDVERDTRRAYQAYGRARAALLGFDTDVRDHLHDNLALVRDAFVAGKLTFPEFSIMRRSFIDNQLAYVDAVAEAAQAWTDLQLAVGEVAP